MPQELKGQVAIVTGAGRGIGRAVAEALAAQGASVAVVARSRDEIDETVAAIAAAGGSAYGIVADVRHPASVESAVAAAVSKFGLATILVNNAGAPGPSGNDWEVDANDWWECIESVVRGAFLFNRAVVPSMVAGGAGRIIHVASTSGTSAPRFPIYASSIAKTALIRLSEELAVSTREAGLAVFAIHPGLVNTRLLASYGFEIPDSFFAPPERAGALCVSLSSGRYDSLSGRFLTIDDDLDGLAARAPEIVQGELYTLRIRI